MLSNKAKKNEGKLNDEIGAVLDSLNGLTTDATEYTPTLDKLEKLYKIKAETLKNRMSFENWIPVLGSIGEILVIVVFESMGHTVTSKALSFVGKPRA